MNANILVIEDDQTVNQLLCEQLEQSAYQVDQAMDGEAGLEKACQRDYDLILLDIMMPKKDGLAVLQSLRLHKQTPVIVLTAKGGEEDRIRGFKTGADDYLIKPFNMTELHLRIEAILRRTHPSLFSSDTLKQAESANQEIFEFNKLNNSVLINSAEAYEQMMVLTLIEFDLLKALYEQKNQVLSKAYLYQNVLKREFSRYDRTLDMHISKIRKKLVAIGLGMNTIKTVRGQGYCLDLSEL